MVTPGGGGEESQTIKLEMTIDKADLERQLGTVFQPAGAGGGGGTGVGGRGVSRKPQLVEAAGKMGKGIKYLAGLVGIGLTLTAMLKLSKVMAAATSAFQSILGAMVDSFLAPFMPLMKELMEWLAQGIGPAGDIGAGAAEIIDYVRKGDIKRDYQSKRDRYTDRYGEKEGGARMDLGMMKVAGESLMDTMRLGIQGLAGLAPGKFNTPSQLETHGQKAAIDENIRRDLRGETPLNWFKTNIMGPMGGDLSTGTVEKEKAAKYAAEVYKDKMENHFNINITAMDREGILREVDEHLRDALSQGNTGKE